MRKMRDICASAAFCVVLLDMVLDCGWWIFCVLRRRIAAGYGAGSWMVDLLPSSVSLPSHGSLCRLCSSHEQSETPAKLE